MSWFKVDDKYHDHPKARRAGLAACGLWLRAGSWSADHLTDGFVPDDVLPRWAGRGVDVFELADTLVEVRLWERAEVGGEPGYRFRKWAKYQPTRAEVERKRAEARERMARVRSNIGDSSRERSGEQAANVRTTPSRPVPTRPDPVVVDARGAGLTDDDLDRIAEKINGDREYARRVAVEVLDRAGETVRKPLAYVLRAIAAEPDRYRRARGNPRPGQAGECSRHAGQWADTCRSCAADRIAGA